MTEYHGLAKFNLSGAKIYVADAAGVVIFTGQRGAVASLVLDVRDTHGHAERLLITLPEDALNTIISGCLGYERRRDTGNLGPIVDEINTANAIDDIEDGHEKGTQK